MDWSKQKAQEDYSYLIHEHMKKTQIHRYGHFFVLMFVTAICIPMLIFNLYFYAKFTALNDEVALLKRNFKNIQLLDDEFNNAVQKFKNDEVYQDLDDTDSNIKNRSESDVFVVGTDSFYDEYYINDDYENTSEGSNEISKRNKRNVVAATKDGILVNSESYSDIKKPNRTSQKLHDEPVAPITAPSYFGISQNWGVSTMESPKQNSMSNAHNKVKPSPSSVFNRRSRVMHREDKSKAVKQIVPKPSYKSLDLSNENFYNMETSTILPDRHRLQNHYRLGRIKPLPTVHYHGDTSRYVVDVHTNYKGNGHLKHPKKTYVDWKANKFVHAMKMDQHFSMDDGEVTVNEPGLYFIYAQIYYLDEHEINGYRVHKNDDTVLQCTISAFPDHNILSGNTCYTAGVEYLASGDKIVVRDLSENRYSLFEPGKSFFGIIKLGDIKIK